MHAFSKSIRPIRLLASVVSVFAVFSPAWAVQRTMTFPKEGGSETDVLTFSGSSFKSPSASVSWLSYSYSMHSSGGKGEVTLIVKVPKNPSSSSRTGTLTMSAGDTPYTLAVTQLSRSFSPTYKVAFNANGGNGKMATQTMTYGKSAKLRQNAFARSGYVFRGWATKKDGAVKYKDCASVKNLRTDGKTTTLYAKWAKKTYKVAFKANGGKGTMATQSMTYGKSAKLRSNTFKRPGYKFLGWAKTSTGAVAFKNAASVKNLRADGKTLVLYAVWAKAKTAPKSAASIVNGME